MVEKAQKEINWKKVRSEMKDLRKNLKEHCGLKISWEEIYMLLKKI